MAFHPYPQVIAAVFNRRAFGPPRGLTPASACPGIAHPASRPRRGTRRPVRTRFRCGSLPTVSGAVSLPSRGAFHLSLAVLVRYRSQGSVQAWMVVHPASDRVPRARPYSGPGPASSARGCVRGSNPLRPAFPCRSAPQPRQAPWSADQGSPAPQPRRRERCRAHALAGLAMAPFRSPLLGGSRD